MNGKDSELLQMRKLFYINEKRLLEYLEYVPIRDKHLDVVSPMILYMMNGSGSQVEPMMAKVIELVSPQQIEADFEQCYRILNGQGMLKLQKVATKEEGIVLSPFIDSGPPWWQAYNSHTKHRLPAGLEKATLGNLLHIHAALFILHSIANLIPFTWGGMKTDQRGVFLDPNNWVDLENDLKNGKPRICWRLDKHLAGRATQMLDFRDVMNESTRMQSDIFGYVTVVKPMLIANVIEGSNY